MNKKERVIFLTDVEGIARKGEIREVREALVRNFLLPKKKVLPYNKTIDRQLQHQKVKLEERQVLARNRKEETFAIVNQRKLTFLLKEKDGRAFGSVTALDIVRLLKEEVGIQIDKRSLLDFKPLHEKGKTSAKVKIGRNLIAEIQIIVDGYQENMKTR